ncbi:MAG: toprim domain-containing protein, partial [Proteobacteria bacterium]|nr:toprim domain-containing protein [Pseudomonadota bacterium]
QRIEFARRKWHEAVPLTDTPADVYLRERGLEPGPDGWPPSLRYHSSVKHGPTGLYLPAMLGAVAIYPSREVVGLHRTFLRADGRDKAPVSNNKMMLGKCGGGAVRLAPAGPELVLSEGIETSLSVQQATGLPVWATLSTSGLRSIILPPEVETVIIAADADEPGEKAAQEAARRFIAEGRKVKIARPPQGMDFNDLLQMPDGVAVISDQRRRMKANG